MKKFLLLSLLFILFPIVVRAATCPVGQYLLNNNCESCREDGYYCPGDDMMYSCPDPTDFFNAAAENEPNLESFIKDLTSWAQDASKGIEGCRARPVIVNNIGWYFYSQTFDSTSGTYPFNSGTIKYWMGAEPGYYLNNFYLNNVYYNISACDNPYPSNAHYSGPGTPDVGNCPWACDAGYGRTAWDTCEPLCTSGITTLRASTGLVFNLYANKLTTPAVHVRPDGMDTVCYGNLAVGGATGAINLHIGDMVYHTTN